MGRMVAYLEETSGRFTCKIVPSCDVSTAQPLARYRPEKLSLAPGSPAGSALDKTEVISSQLGPKNPVLRYRPSLMLT